MNEKINALILITLNLKGKIIIVNNVIENIGIKIKI